MAGRRFAKVAENRCDVRLFVSVKGLVIFGVLSNQPIKSLSPPGIEPGFKV
jgi:hypothetical protein